jgi:hypothetical protein
MIAMRHLRKQFFASEIFDEYGWNMLLQLFVAHAENDTLAERRLIELAETGVETGRRWIELLVKDGQVRVAGGDVMLTAESVERLRSFFRAQDSA